MNGSGGRRLPYTMLILALLVFTVWIAVVPAGADPAVVTRNLPDSVEQNETFVVSLNQSGFFFNAGVVWEVLPEDFDYVNGSYTGDAPNKVTYNETTRTLMVPFCAETSIAYSVNASSYDQTAEFSGTWRTMDSQMNKTNGTVGGDIMVVVSGTPPAPVISSSTHPDEEAWYCNRNATFTWTTPSDASGIACYSYTIDDSSTTTPDTVCDTTGNSKSYTNLEYSIRYFHVRAKDNDDNWGFADHYRVKIENCDAKDGCYAYDTGCEDRDYCCSGGSCGYTYSNRHTDYYEDLVSYCKEDEVWKHRLFHDFYCEAGNCTNHTSWENDTFVENCSNSDGWVDTGNTSWVEDLGNECKEKEQKEQEYRDYSCSDGNCVYNVTDTKWVDTGAVRDKQDGTDCGSDYYDGWVSYCKGDEVWKHRLFHDFYCEAGNCTEHTSWVDDTFVENCSNSDGWVDTGNTSWVEDLGDECKEKEQKEQEYRDYSCSEGSCDYNVTDTQWIDTGNERERISEIDVRPDSCRMNISEERQFSAIATLTAGGTENVTLNASWSSSNTSVLEHLDGGNFKVKGEGIAEVIANYCNTSDRSIVKVNVSENQLPIANFTYSPEKTVVNQIIIFNASNSTDPDGTITKYEWNFGDENITNTTKPIITHSYASGGDYIVNLTVLDNEEAENSTSKAITVYPLAADFDIGTPANPYPSISGTHTGTIKPNVTIEVSTLYAYSCPGTGGHTEFARIWNNTGLNATATWKGYVGDWHNLSFYPSFTLIANETYNYTIRTGSYPRIHHNRTLIVPDGEIRCTKFTDANGRAYYDWIPAFKLFF